jgi:hypothetical protein
MSIKGANFRLTRDLTIQNPDWSLRKVRSVMESRGEIIENEAYHLSRTLRKFFKKSLKTKGIVNAIKGNYIPGISKNDLIEKLKEQQFDVFKLSDTITKQFNNLRRCEEGFIKHGYCIKEDK